MKQVRSLWAYFFTFRSFDFRRERMKQVRSLWAHLYISILLFSEGTYEVGKVALGIFARFDPLIFG